MSKSQDRVIGTAGDPGIAHDHPSTPKTGAPGTPRDRVIGWVRDVLRILRATLREVFDENAYDRFLLRTNSVRSIESYREFLCERDAALSRKPRCC